MKIKLPLSAAALLITQTFALFAQEKTHDANHPCISEEEYKILDNECAKNSRLFAKHSTQLNWPLQAGNGLTDCSFYYISAHVDQDPAATNFKDYNCGTIAYDGHKGTDIAIGPFPFYKMDNNQVEVHAAAAGTIIAWHDGEFDRQCLGSGSNVTANSIVVQHADGSCALYWHMKSNSLTSKGVGQTVAAGEYLGVVGSSGSSSGPHLHFEVWSGSTSATYNDPFSGSCNSLNASTWWANQKPYTESAIIKASVHTTDYIAPSCGTTESSNESTSYTIPFQGAGLSPGYAKFYIFIRNETNGNIATMRILNPGGTVFNTWSSTSTATYKFSYKAFSKLLPTTQGTYTFEATYNGITCSQKFDIINPTGIQELNKTNTLTIFPNPFTDQTTVRLELNTTSMVQMNLFNSIGEKVAQIENKQLDNGIHNYIIKVEHRGVYFLTTSINGKSTTQKIIHID